MFTIGMPCVAFAADFKPDYSGWNEWFRERDMPAVETADLLSNWVVEDSEKYRGVRTLKATSDAGTATGARAPTATPEVLVVETQIIDWPDENAAAEFIRDETPRWSTGLGHAEAVPLPGGAKGVLFRDADDFFGESRLFDQDTLGWIVVRGLLQRGKETAAFGLVVGMKAEVLRNGRAVPELRNAVWRQVRPVAVAEARRYLLELAEAEPEGILPVIFVHGVGGSTLVRTRAMGLAETTLWPIAWGDDRSHLMLERDGAKPSGSTVFAQEPLDTVAADTPAAADVYAPLLDFFKRTGRELKKQLWYFPYDWRLDNAQHLPLLDELVDEVCQATGKKRVNLVTHSMGGLVAKAYVHGPGRNKVGKLISIALPYRGGGFVFRGISEGYDFGNATVRSELMKILLQNWPSGYQIFPRYRFLYDAAGKHWLTAKEAHALRYFGFSGVEENWFSGDDYALTAEREWVNNPDLVRMANRFHRRFNDGEGRPVRIPTRVKHFAIVGWGVPTEVLYKLRDLPPPAEGQGLQLTARGGGVRIVAPLPVLRDGDGKVPLWQSSDFGAGAKFYYIPHVAAGGSASAEHTEITWNSAVHDILDKLLANKKVERSRFDVRPSIADSRTAVARQVFLEIRSAVAVRITDTAKRTVLTLARGKGDRPIDRGGLVSLAGIKHAWMPAEGGPYEVEVTGKGDGQFTISGGVRDDTRLVAFAFPTQPATKATRGRFTVARAELLAATPPVLTLDSGGRRQTITARLMSAAEAESAFGDDLPEPPQSPVDEEVVGVPVPDGAVDEPGESPPAAAAALAPVDALSPHARRDPPAASTTGPQGATPTAPQAPSAPQPPPAAAEQPGALRLSVAEWTEKARGHNLRGEIGDALFAWEQVRQAAPDTPNIDSWLAELHIAARNWPEARAAVERAVRVAPNSGWAWSWQASLEHESGQPERAAATYRRAAQLDPRTAGFRYGNGQMLFQHGQVRRALTDFLAAAALAPAHAGTYYYLGECYAQLGLPDAALINYRHYLQLDPYSEWAARARAAIVRLQSARNPSN